MSIPGDPTKTIPDFLKLAPRYLIPIPIACATLLFPSENILRKLAVFDFAKNNGQWIGLTLIVTTAMVFTSFMADLVERGKQSYTDRKIRKAVIKTLQKLTEDEKNALRPYILQQTKTQYFHVFNGIIQGLEADGIVWPCSPGNMSHGTAYHLSKAAWEHLNENKGLLD